MKRLFAYLIVLLSILFTVQVAHAITATLSGNVIELTTLDADWSWSDTFTGGTQNREGIKIQSIQINPSATDDIIIIEEGSAAGPRLLVPLKFLDTYDQRAKDYNGVRLKPFFDYSDSTIGTPANASITIILQHDD